MKFRSLHILPAALALSSAFIACDDNANTIGGSLSGENVSIVIDSAFTLSGNTVRVNSINPKTSTQLLGNIAIEGFGSLSSSVVTQFLPSTVLDTANFSVENLDSIFLNLSYIKGNFIGDSIAPVGLEVYPLTKLLPDNVASDFDPQGYYSNKPLAKTVYNTSSLDNTAAAATSYNSVDIKLPLELGKYLFNSFTEHPEYFSNGQIFSEKVFPGVYLKTSFGSGRLTTFSATGMTFCFRKITEGTEKNDTTDAVQQYMLVTPEVISNNDMHYEMSSLLNQKILAGEKLLVSPIGTEIEFQFPLDKIIDTYRTNGGQKAVLNKLTMQIPADTIEGIANVAPPKYVLMVLKKDRDNFFAQNKLPDKKTSFYAEYMSSTNSYYFNELNTYLSQMLDKEEITADDYTFSFVPVDIVFEQLVDPYYSSTPQYIESEIRPAYLTPAAAVVNLDKAKIKLTYSKLTQAL